MTAGSLGLTPRDSGEPIAGPMFSRYTCHHHLNSIYSDNPLQPGHNSDQRPNNGTHGRKKPIGGALVIGAVGGNRAITVVGSVGWVSDCRVSTKARADASAGAIRARRGTGATGAAVGISALTVVGAARAGATATAARSGSRCAACGYVLLNLVGAIRAVVCEASARVSLAGMVTKGELELVRREAHSAISKITSHVCSFLASGLTQSE